MVNKNWTKYMAAITHSKLAARFVFGLMLAIFNGVSHADNCIEINDALDGEWRFNSNRILKFQTGQSAVTLDGKEYPISSCVLLSNVSAMFILNRTFITIYLPKGLETTASMVSGGQKYQLERNLSPAEHKETETQSATRPPADPSYHFLVLPSQRFNQLYLDMKTSGLGNPLSEMARAIHPELKIVMKECGAINAFYLPQEKAIVMCYEYMADGERFVSQHYRNQTIKTQAMMKTGIFMGVLFHELGHAMVHLHNLPIIGGEEDVADRIATLLLLRFTEKNPDQGKLMLHADISHQWVKRTSALEKILNGNRQYSDEHSLNEARVYNKVCLAYGSNPALFTDLANQLNLTESRKARCPYEYQQAKSSFEKLMP